MQKPRSDDVTSSWPCFANFSSRLSALAELFTAPRFAPRPQLFLLCQEISAATRDRIFPGISDMRPTTSEMEVMCEELPGAMMAASVFGVCCWHVLPASPYLQSRNKAASHAMHL